MNEQSREPLEGYYKEAASWNADRLDALRRSERRAWWLAGGAATIAVLEALALILLTPLKTVQPYTLLVDRTTGYVQGIDPVNANKVLPDAALTQSLLVQYVTARESFDISTLRTNYNKVALWSAEKARADYLRGVQATNPQSPLALYPRTSIVETRVKSVSPLGRDVALVRFETVRQDAGGQPQAPASWVSVIRYRFSGEPMKLEDRFVNPLGFQVLRYRRDAEAPPPPPEPVPAAGAAVAVQPVAVGVAVPVGAPATTTTTTTTTAAPAARLGAPVAVATPVRERRR
ncbi:MAG TPA: VirB8/TrbF family protein [Allosphingosinicella sp.]|jgi:type IV secretion system protein VirB8